jgi:hypothetical protein
VRGAPGWVHISTVLCFLNELIVYNSCILVFIIEVSIVRYEIRIARFGTSQKSSNTDRTYVSYAQWIAGIVAIWKSDTCIVSDRKYFRFLIWAIGVVISLESCICPRKSPAPSFTKHFCMLILSRDMASLLLRCNRWGKSGRRYWGRQIRLVGPPPVLEAFILIKRCCLTGYGLALFFTLNFFFIFCFLFILYFHLLV